MLIRYISILITIFISCIKNKIIMRILFIVLLMFMWVSMRMMLCATITTRLRFLYFLHFSLFTTINWHFCLQKIKSVWWYENIILIFCRCEIFENHIFAGINFAACYKFLPNCSSVTISFTSDVVLLTPYCNNSLLRTAAS